MANPTALDLTPPTYEVAIGDATYTTRPFTNKLRADLGELLDQRATLHRSATRLEVEAELVNDQTDRPADAIETILTKTDELNREVREVNGKIALKVLVDGDGKPPTKAVLDGALGPSQIGKLVRTVLGEDTANPTQASTAEN